MVDQLSLSSLRNGGYMIRACCTRSGECNFSWEVDIDRAIQNYGDITLPELRGKLCCPRCNAPITTTLSLTK
jgi:hypothetical protein